MSGLITLFVDASFDQATKKAGWGAWAKRDEWRRGQTFDGIVIGANHSHEAELIAIANAIEKLEDHGAYANLSAVLVQTDCVRALQVMKQFIYGSRQSALELEFDDRQKVNPTKAEADAVSRIGDVLMRTRVRLNLRHVYGHQAGAGRSWVNNFCDASAKRRMREQRGRVKRKHHPAPKHDRVVTPSVARGD